MRAISSREVMTAEGTLKELNNLMDLAKRNGIDILNIEMTEGEALTLRRVLERNTVVSYDPSETESVKRVAYKGIPVIIGEGS